MSDESTQAVEDTTTETDARDDILNDITGGTGPRKRVDSSNVDTSDTEDTSDATDLDLDDDDDAEEETTASKISNIDDALKEIEKLRKENAAKRVKNKKTQEAARKWQEYVDSQKSEMELLKERQAELEKERDALRTEKLQRDLAKKYNVDPELAEFIVGDDVDQMRAKAKKLANVSATKKAEEDKPKRITAEDMRAGRTGAPKVNSGGEFLRELFDF